jgi:hypothetical protein
LTDIENIHHVVVYMTGEMPFPEGLAGAGNSFPKANHLHIVFKISQITVDGFNFDIIFKQSTFVLQSAANSAGCIWEKFATKSRALFSRLVR